MTSAQTSPAADRPVAVVTGASSGIGAATARQLAKAGFDVVVGARRRDRLDALAQEIDGIAITLDVTNAADVAALAEAVPDVAVLVNNAGGAFGQETVADAVEDNWRAMYEINVLGTMRVTKALLPALQAGDGGHIVTVDSVAAYEVYPGGAGYTAAKHAETALHQTLRLELLEVPIRVTEVNPGLVNTEFSAVRFDGDADKAANVYQGLTPLVAEDVADCICWAVTRPVHVNIDRIDIKPRAQASATKTYRTTG